MKSNRSLSWALIALWLAVVVSAAGCNRGGSDGAAAETEDGAATTDSTVVDAEGSTREEGDDEEEAVPVEIALLERGPMESLLRSAANLEAENQVSVVSEAARRVRQILVEEGDRVKRGQLLLRLQDDEQRSALARARSQFDRAQREFDRQSGLHEQGLATDQALNDATYELEQQRIGQADAERELGYTEVRASIDGTVTARMVNLGDQVAVGQPLFEIIDFESLVARIYIPEKDLSQLRVGQQARVVSRAVREAPFAGRVERISPVVDPRSGTVKVTVAVGGQEGLRPGLYVDVSLVTAMRDDALRLPKRALIYDNDQIFAYRLGEDGRAERLLVAPRLSDRDYVEPALGFAAGDSIVVAGQAGLKNGARVQRVNIPASGEEAATQ